MSDSSNLHGVSGGRYHPTMKQLVWGTIAFLQSHPRIRNPNIFYPILNPLTNEPEEIKPQVWKTYGGIELIEPGLTLAVYPQFSSLDTRRGAVSVSEMGNKSCSFKPMTLGSRDDLSYQDCATYRLVVQAFYQDPVTPGETVRIPIDRIVDSDRAPWPMHGFNVRVREPDQPHFSQDPNWVAPDTSPQDLVLEPDEVFFDISPGEEILREWMDLLRLALCDLPTMLPFAIRSTEVEAIDYTTSSLFRQPTDVFFHSASLIWRLNLHPPGSWRHIFTMPPVDVNIKTIAQPRSL